MGDFDFLVGSWNVLNRRLAKRLVGSTHWIEFTAPAHNWSLFDGMANVDEIAFPDGTKGMTVRLFNPATQEWAIHWASSVTGTFDPPVVGRFTDGRGVFYGDDVQDGIPVRVRFVWSDMTENSARWQQEFSTDGGDTWELNWTMEFSRV